MNTINDSGFIRARPRIIPVPLALFASLKAKNAKNSRPVFVKAYRSGSLVYNDANSALKMYIMLELIKAFARAIS